MPMEKYGIVDEDTPPEEERDRKVTTLTKEAADRIEAHPAVRAAQAVQNALTPKK